MAELLYTTNMFMHFTMVPMWSIEMQICGCPITFLSFLEIWSDLIYVPYWPWWGRSQLRFFLLTKTILRERRNFFMITKIIQVYLYQHKWACAKIYVYALGDNFNFYLNTDGKWCGMLYPWDIIVKRNIFSIIPIKWIITLCKISDSVTSHVCNCVIIFIRLYTFFNAFLLLFVFLFIFTPSPLLHNYSHIWLGDTYSKMSSYQLWVFQKRKLIIWLIIEIYTLLLQLIWDILSIFVMVDCLAPTASTSKLPASYR